MPERKIILTEPATQRVLSRMAHEIAEHNPDSSTVVLAGVQKGGIHLAARLGSILEGIWGHPVPVGAIDVSMHRDDLDRQPAPTIQPTEIPFDLNGKTVVLVDDVLFSGRTARAALDALNDFGRPHCVQLAVLVDRGHRQLPIMANFIGKEVVTALPERISLHLKEVGGDDVVYLESQPLATLQP